MNCKRKFWRRKKLYLLIPVLCVLVFSTCSKHVVRKELVDALQIKDPPIETLHSAYLLDDAVIVEFSVADPKPHEKEYQKLADRYWAVLVPFRNRWGGPSYKFNRSPLPQEKVENAIPLNIHCLAPKENHQRSILSISEEEFPLIAMREILPGKRWKRGGWEPNSVYLTMDNARYRVSSLEPDGYIPKMRLPLLIVAYPFAFVADGIIGIPELPYVVAWTIFGPPRS